MNFMPTLIIFHLDYRVNILLRTLCINSTSPFIFHHRLNSGIRNIFFVWAFFCFKKLEVIQWIMLFLETSNFFSTPWDFDFEIFHEFLKMRRWRWYTWVFHQCILKITHHFHFPGNKFEFIIILNNFWSLKMSYWDWSFVNWASKS